ncbi:MAG: hypothetical protein Q4F17_12240 [Eubacteriales bacterium]|nr:hypothetical protein [Eubacteriales bacterium]
MTKFKNPLHAKFEVRPSHPALKIALAVLIVFSTAALVALGWVHGAIQQQTQAMKDQAAAIEYENGTLENRLKDPDSIDNVRDIAKEELGLVDPGTVLITPNP